MILRLTYALLLGLLVSFGLFWLMHSMVMNIPQDFKPSSPLKTVDFVRLKRETTTQVKERSPIPDKPPPQKRPPPPPMKVAETTAVATDMPAIDVPALDIPVEIGRIGASALSGVQIGGGSTPVAGSDLIPLVRIAPQYPMRAQMRRIEGWVKVLFTITESGSVKNVEVVEADPAGVFDRAAIEAIEKWRFKPKVVAGEAVEQRAIQTLEFKLKK